MRRELLHPTPRLHRVYLLPAAGGAGSDPARPLQHPARRQTLLAASAIHPASAPRDHTLQLADRALRQHSRHSSASRQHLHRTAGQASASGERLAGGRLGGESVGAGHAHSQGTAPERVVTVATAAVLDQLVARALQLRARRSERRGGSLSRLSRPSGPSKPCAHSPTPAEKKISKSEVGVGFRSHS